MRFLENRIPPPVVLGILGALMWAVAPMGPRLGLPDGWRDGLAVALVLLGLGIDLYCAIAFWRAKTTVNPLSPQNSSALVISGAYRFSRNPMYVGQALVLAGWMVFLDSAWGLAGPVLFVLYLNRFQIEPEERVLAQKFGAQFHAYKARVRRWL
jgi:protein-S-isoprenylcysteine O-methyltransferase Ste14